jgi:hypothetical protein
LRSLPWGPSESEHGSEDDSNYKGHFKKNQYFGGGSEQGDSQITAASPMAPSNLEELPTLDFGEDNSSQRSPPPHCKLTEDVMEAASHSSSEERDLLCWISTVTTSSDSDSGTGFEAPRLVLAQPQRKYTLSNTPALHSLN